MTEIVPRNTRKAVSKVKPTAEINVVQNGLQMEATMEQVAEFIAQGSSGAGETTTLVVGGIAIAAGVLTDNTANFRSITFPAGLFASNPAVSVTPFGINPETAGISSVSLTGAVVFSHDDVGTMTGSPLHWIAIGQAA